MPFGNHPSPPRVFVPPAGEEGPSLLPLPAEGACCLYGSALYRICCAKQYLIVVHMPNFLAVSVMKCELHSHLVFTPSCHLSPILFRGGPMPKHTSPSRKRTGNPHPRAQRRSTTTPDPVFAQPAPSPDPIS